MRTMFTIRTGGARTGARALKRLSPLPLLLTLALLAACGGGDNGGSDGGNGSATPSAANLFPNGGFEDGRDPWYSLKPPDFILADDIAHSGSHSAHLHLEGGLTETKEKIGYLVQEVTPDEFPEAISGYYRVENWNKRTPKQYLQFVVIAFASDNFTEFPNTQIRYLLAGINEPPFQIGNAKFVFLTRDQPVTGEWVHFERNIKEDFEKFWGAAPEGFDKMRLLFEVRYDDKQPSEGPTSADVYYDDLYMGPAPVPGS